MNKLIKELAEQAGYEVDMFGVGHWHAPECQKFAELIIQECARIAELKEQGDPEFDSEMSVGWYMKNHFGVRE